MYITEAVTIESIESIPEYPGARLFKFKDRLYQIVIASSIHYEVGEQVIYIPAHTLLPDWLLKHLNLWDYGRECGMLGGKEHRIVRVNRFARNPNYLNTGIIVKLIDGKLPKCSEPFNKDTTNLEKELGLSYRKKGTAHIFNGDIFLCDVAINKNDIYDLRYLHKEFIDKYVTYQECVAGRQFYISIHRNIKHHSAFGENYNIYVCDYPWGKYRFLSNTKKNCKGNLFIKVLKKNQIEYMLTSLLISYPNVDQITLSCVLRTTAFGNYRDVDKHLNNFVITDIYFGKLPFGTYVPQSEFYNIMRKYNKPYPKTVFEDYYSFDKARELSEGSKYGIVVRDPENLNIASLYNDDYLLNYIREFHLT